jgi:hypothetical protein
MTEPTKEQVEAFLTELTALTIKYGIEIGGCGCCGSPFLGTTELIAPGLDSVLGHYTVTKHNESLQYEREKPNG